MGCYVNPGTFPAPPGAKEAWLKEHSLEIYNDIAPLWHDPSDGKMLVCLVSNGSFTAAVVCYKIEEYEEVVGPFGVNNRPNIWFLVPVEELKTVSPLEHYLELEAKRAANRG